MRGWVVMGLFSPTAVASDPDDMSPNVSSGYPFSHTLEMGCANYPMGLPCKGTEQPIKE